MEWLFLRRKKLNKKGSHIGIILSFVLFITSLIFIFSFFGSVMKMEIDKKEKLNYLEENLIKEISELVMTVNINDNTTTGSCSEFTTPNTGIDNPIVLSVESGGDEFASSISSTKTIFESGKGFSKFYYYSEGLNKTQEYSESGCNTLEIKSVEEKEIILESKVMNFLDLIQTDYENAKELLEIGLEDEFNVEFVSSEETYGETTRDMQTEVFAKELNIEYLTIDGKRENAKLVLKIW